MFTHLKSIEGMVRFHAPVHRPVRPIAIMPDREIVEVLVGGEVFFGRDGKRERFGRGTVFWHTAGEYTICETPRENPYRCFAFEFAVRDRARPVPRVSFWEDTRDMDLFCEEVFCAFHSSKCDRNMLAAYCYATLCWRCGGNTVDRRSIPEVLKASLDFINGHLDSGISVGEIARASGISRQYLFRLFRETLDTTPHQYLLKRRISLAKRLLASNDLPIKTIAAMCGAESPEVFYRQFRAVVGMTPGEYRRHAFLGLPSGAADA